MAWTVPRRAFLLWIWCALPISVALYFDCWGGPLAGPCHAVSNNDVSTLWLLPSVTMFLAPRDTPDLFNMIFPLLFTVGCHLAIRRLAPARPPGWTLAAFILAWAVLGFAAFGGFLFVPPYNLGFGHG